MIKKLKTKSMVKWVIWALVCYAIALVILLGVFGNVFAYLTPAKDLTQMDPEDIKVGMHVKGTFESVEGEYAYRGTETKPEQAAYLIMIGDVDADDLDDEFGYIGLLCSGKLAKTLASDLDKAYSNYEATGEWDDDLIGEYKVDGIVKEINSQTLKFYNDFKREYPNSLQKKFIDLEINQGIFVGFKNDDYIFAFIAVIIIAITGTCFLFYGLLGSNVKVLEKYIKSQPDPDYARQRIEQLATTPDVQGVHINEQYILGIMGTTVYFAESKKCLWAYQHTIQHKTNGVPTGKSYSVMLKLRDGKNLQIAMKNEAGCQEVLKYMGERIPWVIIGYDDKLMHMFNKDRNSMIKIVDDRMNQIPAMNMDNYQ